MPKKLGQSLKMICFKFKPIEIVHQINHKINELIDENQTIAKVLNCRILWIEAIVDANILEKINLQ